MKKVVFKIGQKKCLWVKVKNTVLWKYVINNLNREEIAGTFYKKELQKTNQEEFSIEEVIKRKGINYMWNGKANSFNSWIDKKGTIYMNEYFPEPKSF